MSNIKDLSTACYLSDFKVLPFREIKKMPLEDIIEYYRDLRLFEYLNGYSVEGITSRKLIHPLLLKGIQIHRIANKEKLKVIGNDRVKTDKPIIFACTHIGGNDIQRVFEGIKTHAYLFLGDPKEAYTDFNGKILNLNGVIPFETHDKIDRKIAYANAVDLLKKGGNLLIFPEGTWNLSVNELVLKLFKGTVRMANETHADIVPVAIEQYDNQFYVNIGRNIPYDPEKSPNIDLANEELRDAMATLKYEIFLYQYADSQAPRESIPDDYEETFLKTIVDRCEYDFSLEEMLGDAYKDPNIVLPEEALIVTPKEAAEKRKLLISGYCNIGSK